MRIERTQLRQQRSQAFRQNTNVIKLSPNVYNTNIGKTAVAGIKMPKLGKFVASIRAKFAKTAVAASVEKSTPEVTKQMSKPLFTKDSYIGELINKGKKEGTDYKVFDFDHYKAIEEKDTASKIDRVIRFRKDTSINLIAEYNSDTHRLMGVKRYDELGNLTK